MSKAAGKAADHTAGVAGRSATPLKLLLASSSPRRAQLLRDIGLQFEVGGVAIDESQQTGELPVDYVRRLALAKARADLRPGYVTLAADTIVVLDNEILGKPRGQTEAADMLMRLSGRSHEVLTGVAACQPDAPGVREAVIHAGAIVTFRTVSSAEAQAYWQTGEPADKAGGYGIQGIGGIFAERVVGSYSAVVGLPVMETERLLGQFDIDTWCMRIDG